MAHFNNLTVFSRNDFKLLDTENNDDEWRNVGTTGNPPFSGSWTNFNNTWPYITPNSVAFRKDCAGFVHIKGFATGPNLSIIFNLPVGYRPFTPAAGGSLIFAVDTETSAPAYAIGDLRIFSQGDVTLNAGNFYLVVLQGIHFYAGE